jgi:3-deoxy-manno-octulosonate cytidylyltransferase (CMP-KDO synthetase)
MTFAIVIPARLKSKRLPGKPLIKFNGIPMIVLTYKKCLKATNKKNIFVATDSREINDLCKKNDINCVMTSRKCLTGTDRVAEFAKKVKRDFYINVQGDEPLMPSRDIKKMINAGKKNKNLIINGYTEIKDKKNFFSQHIPKLVFDKNNYLMYMSRGPIPSNKTKKFELGYRQVCIYSFPRKKLIMFSKLNKKSPFEYIEDIEILRFLEIGEKVKMLRLSDKSISVDTKKDKKLVEKILNKSRKII